MSQIDFERSVAHKKSTTDRLIEIIHKLTEAQREHLVSVISDWLEDKREFPRIINTAI